jgi:hypothetical protein
MFTSASLYAVLFALLAFTAGPSAEAKETVESVHDVRIALQLNAILISSLLERYEKYAKQEMNIELDIRAAKAMEAHLPEWKQHLEDTRAEFATIKKKLVVLDAERAKLTKQLKKLNAADEPAAQPETTNRLLEKILERLGSIEKQLEKMERQR